MVVLGCPITYGVFNNDRRWADTSEAVYLFWSPKDNAEFYRHRLMLMDQPPSTSDDFNYIRGTYVAMNILSEGDKLKLEKQNRK